VLLLSSGIYASTYYTKGISLLGPAYFVYPHAAYSGFLFGAGGRLDITTEDKLGKTVLVFGT
jgi:hypothetical protein